MKTIISVVLLLLILQVLPVSGGIFDDPSAGKQASIDYFVDLGILKYGKADASGSREILIMSRDNTGVFTYQHLTDKDGNNFEEILSQKGLMKPQVNPKTGKVEKCLLVFNPKDVNTYSWIPVSELKEVQERIKKTGKTFPQEVPTRRRNEKDLSEMNFNTSF